MTESFWGLEKLKREYEKLRQKYNLPNFQNMNRDFGIEKLQEKETEILSREIRVAMMGKNLAYLRFVEMFMNPSNAPMFFLSLTRGFGSEEKKLLEELYVQLGKTELKSISLDNMYNEKKDAEFIKKFYLEWQIVKEKIDRLMKALEKAWGNKPTNKEKGYLG